MLHTGAPLVEFLATPLSCDEPINDKIERLKSDLVKGYALR